ncbi:MAG: efflux RND transporter periplasmic adaptor subunit [Proteobacteria bacterium]|nr:efflux RND transporter periplasmic adaptor subunit [Pseudomonadota bacterium]
MSPKAISPLRSSKVPQLLGVACIALLTLNACGRGKKDAAAPEVKPALTVTSTAVRNAPVKRSVLASGAIFPWQEVIIGPEVGGYRVSSLNVDIGDKVKRGQVLVQLSNDMVNAEVSSRRAALRAAEARAANSAAAWRRGQAMIGSGALSQANLDTLQADQLATAAAVETARADVAMVELRLRYTQVTAPDDGTITSRTVSVGQIAQTGGEMLRLLRLGRIEWRAEVPEGQLMTLSAGLPVRIVTADGKSVQGKVRTIAPTVQTGNRTALVYADITGGQARPGMFARGEIETGTSEAMLVPVASLVVQDGYSYLFVLGDKDLVQRRLVHTGVVYGQDVEVLDGVKAGERVVVKGAGFLKDGDKVRINDTKPAV